MGLVKVEGWPVVQPDDNGIRPAGRADECFYCHSRIGKPHGPECVTVEKVVRYRVYMNLDERSRPGRRGKYVGTFTRPDPYFWTAHDCEFHKNDSSWCATNAVDEIVWGDPKDAEALEEYLTKNGDCACGPLSFEYDETVDEGPFVTVRGDEE